MRKFLTTILIILLFVYGVVYGKNYTISNSGLTFVPSELNINVGDQVTFSLSSSHNAEEVNKDVWDANGNTTNGGFSVPFGGGIVTFNTPGTYYYVCHPHASLGMKGFIVVTTPTGIEDNSIEKKDVLKAFPNPASNYINVDFSVTDNTHVKINLLDITGRVVDEFVSADYSPGEYRKILYFNNLSPGKYFLNYIYDNKNFVKPILINSFK